MVPRERWTPRRGELRLLGQEGGEEVLASYDEEPACLLPGSISTPPGGVETELVVVERSDEEGSYEGIDVDGRIVLADGDPDITREIAVGRRGAIGLVFDSMREIPPVRTRSTLPDAVEYRSFRYAPDETRCFGFSVSPRTGDRLRKLASSRKEEGGRGRGSGAPLRVRAVVDADSGAGTMEVVWAFLPGEIDDEVVLTAHLCHPLPGANDNASGCAALLEAARALNALIGRGALDRPRRGIRFLLMPEYFGTVAYLSRNEELIPRMVCGLNLDMVGADQELCGSTLIAESPPRCTPSFAGDLAALIAADMAGGSRTPDGTQQIPRVRQVRTRFSGGSDHHVLSDPMVGVPSPMLIQWPDRHYHTTHDLPDKIDPDMLALAAGAAATYAYFCASAGRAEATWLLGEMTASFASEVHSEAGRRLRKLFAESEPKAERASRALSEMDRVLRLLLEWKRSDLRSLTRLVDGADSGEGWLDLIRAAEEKLVSAVNEEQCRARRAIRGWAEKHGLGEVSAPGEPAPSDADTRAAGIVPRRRFKGPMNFPPYLAALPDDDRRTARESLTKFGSTAGALATHALLWADGKRSLAEIADLVEGETGLRDTSALIEYAELLDKMGLLELITG